MGKLNIFLTFFYILLFILKEIKKLLSDFGRIFTVYFRYYNIYKLIHFQFNNNVNPLNNKSFINFINQNKKLWNSQNNKIKKINKNKKVFLVTSFVHHHPAYPYLNSIIGKYLEEFYNSKLIGFCDNYDIPSEIIMRSFGIKKFYYLYDKNFFIRFFYFFIALIKIKKIKNINKFFKLKYNGIDIGKIVYDDIIRRSGTPTFNQISFKMIYHLSEALNKSDQYKKILDKISISSIVQAETQFIPSAIIFQQTLKNKKKVYSRAGSGKQMSIKIYDSFSERYTTSFQQPKNLFNLIYKKSRKITTRLGYELVKRRYEGIIRNEKVIEYTQAHENKKNYSKKKLSQLFNWDINKPIAVIFSHSLIDGNYKSGSRIFQDNLTWLRETLSKIKDIDKFNWIIKPHPLDGYYQFAKTSTETEYEKIVEGKNHVKMAPKNISSISLSKVAKVALTSHGSVCFEYVCMGIPVITAGRSAGSDLNINYRAKSKKEYFYYLNNINKIAKPSKTQLDKARTYAYIDNVVIKNNNGLVPDYDTTRDINESKFFQDCTKVINKYSHSSDEMKKKVFHQFETNSSQTVNLKILNNVLKIKKNKYDTKKI